MFAKFLPSKIDMSYCGAERIPGAEKAVKIPCTHDCCPPVRCWLRPANQARRRRKNHGLQFVANHFRWIMLFFLSRVQKSRPGFGTSAERSACESAFHQQSHDRCRRRVLASCGVAQSNVANSGQVAQSGSATEGNPVTDANLPINQRFHRSRRLSGLAAADRGAGGSPVVQGDPARRLRAADRRQPPPRCSQRRPAHLHPRRARTEVRLPAIQPAGRRRSLARGPRSSRIRCSERLPVDEFRRALAGAARAIARDPEAEVVFASEGSPPHRQDRARAVARSGARAAACRRSARRRGFASGA